MRELIEAVAIEGTTIAVRVRLPEGGDGPTLAVATALRAFARYPIVDRLTLTCAGTGLTVSREQAEQWLAPDGLAALDTPAAWPGLLARALEAFRASPPP